MYEDQFLEKMFERILEHYKENQTMSRSRFIQIIKEENHRILVKDHEFIYGELEIDATTIYSASPVT